MIKAGAPTKADLYVVESDRGPVVIKDFARKPWWVRPIGRMQISREYGAYRWLGDLPGIPRLVGRVDRHALAIEHIEGKQLWCAAERLLAGAEIFPRIEAVLARLHDKGLVHWDLRTRDNVLVLPDGDVCVLDFASAFWARPGGIFHRLLFRRMQLIDRSALLKWQEMLHARPFTAGERAFLRRYRFWRSLWIFNRKRERNADGEAPGGQ